MFPVCKASPKSEKKWDEAFDIYASNEPVMVLSQKPDGYFENVKRCNMLTIGNSQFKYNIKCRSIY